MKRFTAIVCAFLLACGLVVGPSPAAVAAPGADIAAASKKLQTMEEQMATAQKNYQASVDKLAKARKNAANSRAELEKINERIATDRQALNIQANYMYREGPASYLEALLSSESFAEVFRRITLLSQVSDSNAKVIDTLRRDMSLRKTTQADLDQQLKVQEAQTAALKRLSDQATRALADQQAYVDNLSAQQAAALDAARAAANERAAASSKPESGDNPSGGGGDYTGTGKTFSGLATWYGIGKGTASGERFDPTAMTAAHKTLPFGTLVRVNYKGRTVVVRINDRGPYGPGRVIDLTRGAADVIGLTSAGVGQVTCEIVN